MAELFLRRAAGSTMPGAPAPIQRRTKKKKQRVGICKALISSIDPYIMITMKPSGVSGKTGVIDGGGCDVIFSEQDNNVIYLPFDGMPALEAKDVVKPTLQVEAFDEDPGQDDFIGRGTVKLGLIEPNDPRQKRVDLVDEQGEEYSGSVALTIVWKTPVGYVFKSKNPTKASVKDTAVKNTSIGMDASLTAVSPRASQLQLDPTKHYLQITVHSATKLRDVDAKPLMTVSRALCLIIVFLGVSIGILCAKEPWTFVDAFYFCVVTLTTVGYGDLTPSSDGSKIFVSLFALASVGLIAVALGHVTAALFEKQQELLNRVQEEDDPDAEARTAQWKLLTVSLFFLIMMATGILTFALGEGHNFVDSFYFTTITMTTVGLGDFSFKTQGGRLFCTFWMILATVSTGRLICELVDGRMQARAAALAEAKRQRVLLKKDALSMLDKSGDGQVDKMEFLAYKLVAMGRVQAKDIDEILARFDQLDADKSGFLTLDELEESEG